jgi:transcriptional regulator with XRE-family HTH domain
MRGEELKALRKQTRLTQGQLGEIVGLTAAYIGELERSEKRIDTRLAGRLNAALRTRIDISYSNALKGWTVAVTAPIPAGSGPPGRRHMVIGKYPDAEEAKDVAEELKATTEKGAQIYIYPRVTPPNTTNTSGF